MVQLIVNDGKVNSAPDTVTITTTNTLPVANAGPDQTVFVGTTVQLDGSQVQRCRWGCAAVRLELGPGAEREYSHAVRSPPWSTPPSW